MEIIVAATEYRMHEDLIKSIKQTVTTVPLVFCEGVGNIYKKSQSTQLSLWAMAKATANLIIE